MSQKKKDEEEGRKLLFNSLKKRKINVEKSPIHR